MKKKSEAKKEYSRERLMVVEYRKAPNVDGVVYSMKDFWAN
jgi:hypothetical protein